MLKLEHVGICAKDTVALKNWYVKVFDFKVVYDNRKDKPTFFLLMEDGNMIEIYPADQWDDEILSNKERGIRHLAFGTHDAEKEYQKILKHNVVIIDELKVNIKGIKTAFFKDLEGNIIHFIERPVPLV